MKLGLNRLSPFELRESIYLTLLRTEYKIKGHLSFYVGERNLTVLIDRAHLNEKDLVMKVVSSETDMGFIEAKIRAMEMLNRAHGKIHPAVIPTVYGDNSTMIELGESDHFTYVMEFAEGTPLAKNKALTKPLLWDIGKRLALMGQTLAEYDSHHFDRQYEWAPHLADHYLNEYWRFIPEDAQSLIEQAIGIIKTSLSESRDFLKRQVIHSDVNDENIFYHRRAITGIIDLGDAVKSFRICELANCITYLLFDRKPLVGILAHVVRGYTEVTPLPKEELRTLIDFILLRLILSLAIGYFNEANHPNGQNLIDSRTGALYLLKHFLANPDLIDTCRKAAMRHGE